MFEAPFCTDTAFTLKLYAIVPPPVLAAVAVNWTLVPAQIDPAGFAAIVTVGVLAGVTVIVIVLDEAVVELIQVPPLILISTVTASPLASVVVV